MVMAILVADALGGSQDTEITGTVYDDANADGVKNNGENGIPGWTVYLDLDQSGTLNHDAAGVIEPSVLTNQDGDYRINFLKPNTYRISEIVPSGWSPSPTTLPFQDVVVTNTHETKADFFNVGVSAATGGIRGIIWNDLDADGIRDTDPVTGDFIDLGLEGWTVYLDLNNNRDPDPLEPITLTDANGEYTFTDLASGDYEVVEVLPAGWEVSPTFDNKQTVAVSAGSVSVAGDFANFSNLNGSIQGTVWNDLNADGIRDVDPGTGAFIDDGLSDWTIYLDLNQNLVPDLGEPTTLTNGDGDYSFSGLLAGDYEVTQVLPAGWNVSPTFDIAQTVAVVGGGVSIARDFANFSNLNGSIRGTVWNDLDVNGIRAFDVVTGTFTEPGLEGWTIYIDLNRNNIVDASDPSMLTDINGDYVFTGLQIGDYEVREVLPVGWEVAPTFSDNNTVAVFGGVESIAPDFANFNPGVGVPGSVSGTVWNDLNGNGLRGVDPVTGAFTEPGLAGWTVFVDLNSDGLLSATDPQMLSGADGSYSFAGILPGSVTIYEQVPAGWRATNPVSNVRAIALGSGQHVVGLDFGNQEIQDSAIRGTVYSDTNKDGVRSPGERGLPGITMYLDLNNNGLLEAGEPQTLTLSDLFFTPAIDETGTYSFTHLAAGTYHVREIVPVVLSATPEAQRLHDVTLLTTESHNGVDFGNVFRANEIRGVDFDDRDGDHVRDVDEPGIGGSTVYIDSDRDNLWDEGEPTTVTLEDGSFVFPGLTPGAYVVRRVHAEDYEHTYPETTGGILWPDGVSNPTVGNVDPLSITTSLAQGETHRQIVSLTLPNTGALTNLVDVFLLFDDTGSFVNNSPIVRAAFPSIIASLQAALPGIDLGFGVGRLEEYGNFASEYSTGRPFSLNQPIVAASTPGYLTAIQAALDRTTPGYGGDQPETVFEALYQVVTGAGFDGNNNGSVLDSGVAGPAATQLNPGASGDVPSFASFTADAANNVMPAGGNVGGVGFRPGALPIILTATDTGFAYQPKGETSITGLGGLTLPVSALTQTSRPSTPFASGAGIQQTITGLNALGALVIGLGTNPQANIDPRQGLEAISKLTGAINQSAATIANGTADPIAPGDPLYFQIASGFGASVANGVVSAIQNAVTNVAVNITVQASDPRVHIINHTGVRSGVGSGQTATFDIEFVGDGRPHRFDLQFVREGTGVVLGSIPVVIGTPIPGDGYEYEDLEDGEIEDYCDFGSRLTAVSGVVSRGLSYNNSVFDGYTPDASAADDNALAIDKSPLLPGGTATFSNYSSYSRGINALVVDIMAPAHTPTVDDFAFKIGNSNDPGTWTAAPMPLSVSVRTAAGVGGSDRVEIVWNDGAIKNTWLQTTVSAGLGLSTADVFYFGNAVGESGGASDALVNATDEVQTRNNARSFLDPAPIGFNFDFNRDGFVNATDQIIARSNSTTVANVLKWISLSGVVVAVSEPVAPLGLLLSNAGPPTPQDEWASPSLPQPDTSENSSKVAKQLAALMRSLPLDTASVQLPVRQTPFSGSTANFASELPGQYEHDFAGLVDEELVDLLAVGLLAAG